jgi:general secretion pathway protein G
MMPPSGAKAAAGFTLIEMLVALAIMGLLAALAVPAAQTVVRRRDELALRRDLREIRQAIDDYKRAYDQGRIVKNAAATGYPPNLAILVEGVPDQRNPKRSKLFFLRRIPRDPLNPDTALSAEQSWGKRSYASEADAPQEGDDVYDVYSMSARLGLNNVAYRQW